MKIVCVSDMHGQLYPPSGIPECDILINAGDTCPARGHSSAFQSNWLNTKYRRWLEKVPAKHIVWIGGNHSICLDEAPGLVDFDKMPGHYLINNSVEINEVNIWGCPYTPPFLNWYFMASEEKLEQMYQSIPEDMDIIVSHGPPYGYGDTVEVWEHARSSAGDDGEAIPTKNIGSHALLHAINRIKPKILVCGHCHKDYGQFQYGNTLIVNCSLLNEAYSLVRTPIMVEI